MNGPVPIAQLRPLVPGDTGEGHPYGDMYGGLTTYWKDAGALRLPLAKVPQVSEIEPIESVRARVAANQRVSAELRGDKPLVDQTPPEITEIRRIIEANQRDVGIGTKPKPPGWS